VRRAVGTGQTGPMLQELDGKVAVITGGGSGIGAALAEACAAEGMRVVVGDLDGDRAEAVAAELPEDTAYGKAVDVADAAQVQELADFAFDTFGAVHLLCNNAGVSPVGRVWDYSDEDFRWLVGVNLFGVENGLRSFVPRMLEQGEGHIVNTGSGASFVSTPRLGPYCATKHAIVGLSESLAVYLRPRGIGVSCFCPAGVMTNIVEQITFYGEPQPPRGPDFGVVDAETAAQLVVEGVTQDRFLIVTTDDVHDELRELGDDVDAYLRRVAGAATDT